MKKLVRALLPSLLSACASAPRFPQTKGSVDVYEAPASVSPGERRLPEGCRLLSTSVPIDQMERERAMSDPYCGERAAVAQEGGTVLLVG